MPLSSGPPAPTPRRPSDDLRDLLELPQELALRGVPYRPSFRSRVGSTQDLVAAAARAGEPEGLVVFADLQTSGRGRAGRRWEAPPGTAVMFSLLWRPPVGPDHLSTLPLVAGLAIAVAVAAVGGPRVEIKWPNDCLV
ncbi:MAG: biotin--[acetyl-CoA-carboxylase] ligase, partial [Candidatus Dormiibacterota bacterium]